MVELIDMETSSEVVRSVTYKYRHELPFDEILLIKLFNTQWLLIVMSLLDNREWILNWAFISIYRNYWNITQIMLINFNIINLDYNQLITSIYQSKMHHKMIVQFFAMWPPPAPQVPHCWRN